MKLISTNTLSSNLSSITLSSLPQTYDDLLITVSSRSTYGNVDDMVMGYFNSSTSGYSGKRFWSYGTGASTDTLSSLSGTGAGTRLPVGPITGAVARTSSFGTFNFYITNYATSMIKTTSSEGAAEANSSNVATGIYCGLWNSTAPITSVTLDNYFYGLFVAGSVVSVYGITKGSGGATVA